MHNCTNPLAKLKPKQFTDDGRQVYCTHPLAEIQPKQSSFVMGSIDEVNCTLGENFNNLALELMTRVACTLLFQPISQTQVTVFVWLRLQVSIESLVHVMISAHSH